LSQQKAIVDFLRKDDNLTSLSDKAVSRQNLGLGALATMDVNAGRQALGINQLENEMVGIPLPYPGATAPDGWLKCNGQSFNKSIYPLLAERYPSGFLPDLRGEFIRGWDDGRGVDAGRELLSAQMDEIKEHLHFIPSRYAGGGGSSSGIWAQTAFDNQPSPTNGTLRTHGVENIDGSPAGGWETRPRNIAFNYIVRAA
jgi:microcystin-dependent protein